VGKSSLINSLKRERAVGVGATPGYTRAMQEVHIDKHVKLLDCPGIVFSESSSESDLVLRNCIKVEQITDTVKPGNSNDLSFPQIISTNKLFQNGSKYSLKYQKYLRTIVCVVCACDSGPHPQPVPKGKADGAVQDPHLPRHQGVPLPHRPQARQARQGIIIMNNE
jgi:hypothetical protein